MKNRYKQIIFAVMAVWMLGYFHHYFATSSHLETLETQNAELQQQVRLLAANMDRVTKVSVKTTAYSTDDYSINVPKWRDNMTATNKRVKRGMVAADWRVFPPGTRLYIPGYGEAVVEDRGGAVKGNHLDLFVDTYKEARSWGVRNMDVYVIEVGNRTRT